jgi:DNA polymerase-3 subunit alpha
VLDDKSGRLQANIYSEKYQQFGHLLAKDKVYIFEGDVSFDDFNEALSMTVQRILDFATLREQESQFIRLVAPANIDEKFAEKLAHTIEPFRDGGCNLKLSYQTDQAKGELVFPDSWAITPSDECLERLEELMESVEIVYS